MEDTGTLVGEEIIAKLHLLFLRLLYTEAITVQTRSKYDGRCIQQNMHKYHYSLYKLVQVCWHQNWLQQFQQCLSLLEPFHRSQDRSCKIKECVAGSQIEKACKVRSSMDYN